MPSLPETIDERFDEIVAELRAAKPAAPDTLRERVRSLAAAPAPAPARRPRLRLAYVLVPAAVGAIALGGASVAIRNGGDATREAGEEAATTLPGALKRQPATGDAEARRAADSEAVAGQALERAAPARQRAVLPPSRARLQDYRVDLRVRVRDLDALSGATARAMRTTRSLGGFVVSARYDAPRGGHGDSLLVVRVPIGRVQDAIARFSQLGTIVSQAIAIDDLQQAHTRESGQIDALRRTIARLRADLRNPGLSDVQREELRLRLANARERLAAHRSAREQLERRGRLARVSLTLTTREAAPAPPGQPGELEQTLRSALAVLATVLTWLLAALIVAAPFLALGALAVVLERRRRRRAEERLLARAAP